MSDGPLFDYRARRQAGDIKHDPAQVLAVEKLQALHNQLKTHEPDYRGRGGLAARFGWFKKSRRNVSDVPNGLYLYGSVGRGKSLLMDLFMAAAPVERKRRVHFHAFMQEVHGRLHDWRQATRADTAAALPLGDPRRHGDPMPSLADAIADNAWLLCFDEFHVSNIADAMILGRLFEALFERGVVVVATSNWSPGDLYKDGLQRDRFLPFIDLIRQKMDIHELTGDSDHRLGRMAGVTVYHTPLGRPAADAMAKAFRRLAKGAPGAPERLAVQGRTLPVPKAIDGVGWFGFADLCQAALGPADYLAVARTYHTVMLSDIPRMTPAQRNEARRFMTLVDSLYEHKCELICSADSPPHQLYPAGDGAFEFLRTISRLVEMQSKDYLALDHDPDAARAPVPAGGKAAG